jgi:hypothetical protein
LEVLVLVAVASAKKKILTTNTNNRINIIGKFYGVINVSDLGSI